MSADFRLGLGLTLLILITVGVLAAAGVPHRAAIVVAASRAMVQLTLVALALRGVFARPVTVIALLAVMFVVATGTAARRLRSHPHVLRAVAIACSAGAGVTIGIIVGLPVLTRDIRTFVAVAGIVLGGTMSAATLTGRRLTDGLRTHRDEVEAWLSLGSTMRWAVRDIAREAVYEALIPALDQTRTVGLVSFPGAFVGALLGGASAGQAARLQVVVLVGLLCAQAITAVTLAYLLGAPRALPDLPGA
jgi:putative ABC transport system permease protein